MLTSDENIVSVNFNVQYQVSDARKFLFSVSAPEDTLREASEAAVRSIVGAHSMDDILTGTDAATDTTGTTPAVPVAPVATQTRDTLQQQTREILQQTLDAYDAGLQVTDVSFQNVAPPEQVKDAFDDVNAAREDKQGFVNNARAYANQVIPQATGDAARIGQEAEGYKAERIAHAQGDTERFNLILKQYKAAPEVTRRRLWLETMERVLTNNPKVIDGTDGRNIINLSPGSVTSSSTGASNVGAVMQSATTTSDDASKEKQP
jgi:membrane protease subunit HflK